MNILITGATGFIGKNLVEALRSEGGHKLYALVRNISKADFLKEQAVGLICGDITDSKSLSKILDYKIDAIFHCAGFVEDRNWDKLYKTNVLGTENICELAQKLSVRRLVYLSSVAVVSGNPQIPLSEDLPYSATNLYGLSKIEAERKVLQAREQGLKVAILRPCMVYGEGEPHLQGRLLFLLKYHLLPLPDAGKNRLHLVYVKNVTGALIASLHRDGFLEKTFFVADEEVLTLKEIFSIFSQAISAANPIVLPSWLTPILAALPYAGRRLKFFLKDRIYDTSRIKSVGFRCNFKTRDSLFGTARYWLRNR